jgi:hypothetical protein
VIREPGRVVVPASAAMGVTLAFEP